MARSSGTKVLAPVQAEAIPADKKQMIVRGLMAIRATGPPKSDLELEDRLTRYFQFCADGAIMPGVESMALAIGVDRTTIYAWSRGQRCGTERQNLIKAAKNMLSAFMEQAMQRGQINPAAGIFLMKNWFNYRDTRSFEIEQTESDDRPKMTLDEIRAKLRADIPDDDAIDGEFREP